MYPSKHGKNLNYCDDECISEESQISFFDFNVIFTLPYKKIFLLNPHFGLSHFQIKK